jgi:flagellar biogenesis protein FliO
MEISVPTPIFRGALGRALQACYAQLSAWRRSQRKPRALLVKETAGLGERRFVAVLQFERQRFLIGGSPGSITLLARLPEEESTGDVRK